MAWGTMAVDWETRVDYDRLRAYRLQRTKEQLTKNQIGAFLCFDFNNIRYITGVHVGEWARDKMQRYVVLPRGGEPTLFEVGTAAVARKRYAPWMADHIRTGVAWQRGAVPQADLVADRLVATVKQILCEYGVEKEPVAIDIMDVTLLNALRKAGIENLVDAQSPMLDARLIKSADEVQLLKAAAMIADSAYDTIVRAIRPGIRENELVGLANETMYRLGSEDVECVNVVSGPRTSPHPHVFSDRAVRPGDIVFFDLMHAFNGYRTCYYRTFMCGRPSGEQKAAYRQCYEWLYAAVKVVRPGITSADIASVWPTCEAWGLKTEAEARGMATGHGIGLSIHEKPVINRLFSFEKPFPIQEGMVFALETYAQTPDAKHGVRIEEEVLVTADGHEVLTGYPCEELISCGVPQYWIGG